MEQGEGDPSKAPEKPKGRSGARVVRDKDKGVTLTRETFEAAESAFVNDQLAMWICEVLPDVAPLTGTDLIGVMSVGVVPCRLLAKFGHGIITNEKAVVTNAKPGSIQARQNVNATFYDGCIKLGINSQNIFTYEELHEGRMKALHATLLILARASTSFGLPPPPSTLDRFIHAVPQLMPTKEIQRAIEREISVRGPAPILSPKYNISTGTQNVDKSPSPVLVSAPGGGGGGGGDSIDNDNDNDVVVVATQKLDELEREKEKGEEEESEEEKREFARLKEEADEREKEQREREERERKERERREEEEEEQRQQQQQQFLQLQAEEEERERRRKREFDAIEREKERELEIEAREEEKHELSVFLGETKPKPGQVVDGEEDEDERPPPVPPRVHKPRKPHDDDNDDDDDDDDEERPPPVPPRVYKQQQQQQQQQRLPPPRPQPSTTADPEAGLKDESPSSSSISNLIGPVVLWPFFALYACVIILQLSLVLWGSIVHRVLWRIDGEGDLGASYLQGMVLIIYLTELLILWRTTPSSFTQTWGYFSDCVLFFCVTAILEAFLLSLPWDPVDNVPEWQNANYALTLVILLLLVRYVVRLTHLVEIHKARAEVMDDILIDTLKGEGSGRVGGGGYQSLPRD